MNMRDETIRKHAEKQIWCVCVESNQRNGADLNEKMSFLQLAVLQLIRLVGVIKCTDQLIDLQQVILT